MKFISWLIEFLGYLILLILVLTLLQKFLPHFEFSLFSRHWDIVEILWYVALGVLAINEFKVLLLSLCEKNKEFMFLSVLRFIVVIAVCVFVLSKISTFKDALLPTIFGLFR